MLHPRRIQAQIKTGGQYHTSTTPPGGGGTVGQGEDLTWGQYMGTIPWGGGRAWCIYTHPIVGKQTPNYDTTKICVICRCLWTVGKELGLLQERLGVHQSRSCHWLAIQDNPRLAEKSR